MVSAAIVVSGSLLGCLKVYVYLGLLDAVIMAGIQFYGLRLAAAAPADAEAGGWRSSGAQAKQQAAVALRGQAVVGIHFAVLGVAAVGGQQGDFGAEGIAIAAAAVAHQV